MNDLYILSTSHYYMLSKIHIQVAVTTSKCYIVGVCLCTYWT